MYIELHAASAFSFLEAASLPERLAERAQELGYPALALLDRDGVYGAPRLHQAMKERDGLRAIIGAELTVALDPPPGSSSAAPSRTWRLPVLVETPQGYRNLCRLITAMKLRAPKGEGALTLADFEGFTGGLVALAGRPLLLDRAQAPWLLDRLVGLFGGARTDGARGRSRVYVELQRHLRPEEETDNHLLRALADSFRLPLLATNGVRFATADERPLCDVLTCIRHKTTLAQAGRLLVPNAERYLKSPQEMAQLFADLPEAVTATRTLADRLTYSMADLGYRFPDYPLPDGETKDSYLRAMTYQGARDRFGEKFGAAARAQIDKELALIAKLDLAGYFLIVWDIIRFCHREDILVQGRGSAANSAVCYSLGITAIDPVAMELLFERFLTEERGEWPDIDLDLPSGDRRERVIQYVYQRYGPYGAAMTANVITYRGRSAAREVGKTLGIETGQVDRLAKVMNNFEFKDPGESLARDLRDTGFNLADATIKRFAELWARMQHLPRHLGQHSGGMVVCRGRLDEVVPLENASMPGRVVVQWDKDDCADMKIIKVDLLGLGMMAVLQDALTIINSPVATATASAPTAAGTTAGSTAGTGSGADSGIGTQEGPATREVVDLAHLPADDPKVYAMLQAADTIGVFQVESRAQMATLPRLKPTEFYDLVVEVAIIRPGPIVGNMVHPYLKRRAKREPVTYLHPDLEPVLKRTLGVPLFQEQLLRMAMIMAGFTGGQAEELRRALGFRRFEEKMRKIEGNLRAGMAARGLAPAVIDQIVEYITAFALYGFPESHAASFALLAYASAYLKAHYAPPFYAALLNNQPMGFYHPATLVKDAQRHGVRFACIDAHVSDWLCRVEPDGTIRLGLMYVQGLRSEMGKRIATCRAARPQPRPFASLEDLVAVTGLRRDELATLAEVGALNSFGYDRRTALWQIERAVRPRGELFAHADADADGQRDREQGQEQAQEHQHEHEHEPEREREPPPEPKRRQEREQGRSRARDAERASPLAAMTPLERVMADYQGTGLTIGTHPMTFRRPELQAYGVLRAIDLPRARPGRSVRVAGAVITRQRPGTAKGFVFLTLEDETGIANIIVRPDLFTQYRVTIVGEPFVLVEGILQQQDGVTSVKAERVIALRGEGPAIVSHDFH
jgi:error-prone DNA polymerase